jgi:O-antigen/teichoic acid export membrane protein
MAAGLAGTLVFSRSEVLVLDWFGRPQMAGIFALAYGVAAQITAPVDAVIGPLGPAASALAGAYPNKARSGRQRAVRVTALLSGGILATVAPAFASVLDIIYGRGFSGAQLAFLVLAAGSCLQSVCNPFQVFQRARRRAGRLLVFTVSALVIDLVTALLLIPPLGLNGALVANLGGQLGFLGALIVVEARDAEETIHTVLYGMRAYLVGLLAAGLAYEGPILVGAHTWLAATEGTIIGGLAFVVGVRLLRCGLLPADWNVVSAALPARIAGGVRLLSLLLGNRA